MFVIEGVEASNTVTEFELEVEPADFVGVPRKEWFIHLLSIASEDRGTFSRANIFFNPERVKHLFKQLDEWFGKFDSFQAS